MNSSASAHRKTARCQSVSTPVGFALLLLALFTRSAAAPSPTAVQVDPGFTPPPALELGLVCPGCGEVGPVLLQPDGKVIVVVEGVGHLSRGQILRLNADGTLDWAFNAHHAIPAPGRWWAHRGVPRVALQKDGKIVLWAVASSPLEAEQVKLVRLNTDGSLDPGFGQQPFLQPGYTHGPMVLQQADGRLVVSVVLETEPFDPLSLGRRRILGLYRLHADGSLDETFHARLHGFESDLSRPIHAVALQKDGGMLLFGSLVSVNGLVPPSYSEQGPYHGARLNREGLLDMSFPPMEDRGYERVLVQPDDKLLFATSRLNADGTWDAAFREQVERGLHKVSESPRLLTVQPDGKILYAAPHTLIRLRPDGALDAVTSVKLDSGSIFSAIVQPDGKMLVAGSFGEINGIARAGLARLIPGGPQHLSAAAPRSTGVFRLTFGAVPVSSVTLEASTDLLIWQPLSTNTATGLTLEFEDADAPNHPRRFYRAKLVTR